MKLYILLLVPIIPFVAYSQTNPTIRSGRPGQSINPYAVGKYFFQIESGFDYQKMNSDEASESRIFNNFIRYGLLENFDLNMLLNYQKDIFQTTTAQQSGFSDLQPGLHYNFIPSATGPIPSLGLQARFRLPYTDSDYRSEQIEPIIILVTDHQLSDSLTLNHNLEANTAETTYTLISNLSYSLTDKWSTYLEIYAESEDSLISVFTDTGMSYLYSNDLQFDLQGGGGSNHGRTEKFIGFGVSWRTPIGPRAPINMR